MLLYLELIEDIASGCSLQSILGNGWTSHIIDQLPQIPCSSPPLAALHAD
jgi:hypothetical protein